MGRCIHVEKRNGTKQVKEVKEVKLLDGKKDKVDFNKKGGAK